MRCRPEAPAWRADATDASAGSGTGKRRRASDRLDLRAMQVEMETHEREPLIRVPRPRDRMRRDDVPRIEALEPGRQGLQQGLVALQRHDPVAERPAAPRPRDLGRLLPRYPGQLHDLLDRSAAVDGFARPGGPPGPDRLG